MIIVVIAEGVERDYQPHIEVSRAGFPRHLPASVLLIIADNNMKKYFTLFTSIILLTVTAVPLQAATEIIPFAGFRASSDFEDFNSGNTRDVDDEASYGVEINIDAGPDTQYELLYSRQSSKLQASSTYPANVPLDIDIEYIHIGGIKLFPINSSTRSYLGAGLGATRFDAGFDTESKFSFNISGGIKKQISKHVGFRVGLRAFGTSVDRKSAIFCGNSGGCTARFKSDLFAQYEASVGLILKF